MGDNSVSNMQLKEKMAWCSITAAAAADVVASHMDMKHERDLPHL